MGGILRPSQGLRHLQPFINRRHTGKIWCTPKTMISNQTHVQQKSSQAHHWQDWDIHWLQSGCQAGKNMAPVLFMFLVMAFVETQEDKWMALVLSKAQFACKNNSPRSTRQLVIYWPGTFLYRTLFGIFCTLYVDDGAFVFESRTNIERGIPLLYNYFTWLGLKIHIGTE